MGKAVLEQYHTGKGTGRLGAESNPDFDEEYIKIQREMRRIGLRT